MSDDALQGALRDAAALLRFQGELGLEGLDAGEVLLHRRPPPIAAPSAAQPVPASPPEPELAEAPKPVPSGQALLKQPLPDDADAALAQIRDELGPCTRCKLSKGRTNIVYGVGASNARLVFVGEAPGRDEDLQGEPFVGRAGELLNKMIVAMGLRRQDIYIANIIKCRPPRNRDPEPDEVAECEPFLVRQLAALQPEVIVALGRISAQTLLRRTTAISRLRGKWTEYEGIPLMPTFHPAYLLRNPAAKKDAWADLQLVMQRLGLEDPRKRS